MSENDILLVTHLVSLENIRSIVFSDRDASREHIIGLFSSIFDIQQFSKLNSLTFGRVDRWSKARHTIVLCDSNQHIPTQLYFNNLENLIENILSSVHSTLQHLTLLACNYSQYRHILHCLPNLKTFVIGYFELSSNDEVNDSSRADEKYQQLISLTILDCQLLIEYIRLILISVPSLTYLKLISFRSVYGPVFDGSFWEQLIQIRLSKLKKFEFCFTYRIRKDARVHTVNSIIASFRTPFWLYNKQWFTTCDHLIKSSYVAIYTIPIYLNDHELSIRYDAMPINSVCRLIEYRTTDDNLITEENISTLNLHGLSMGEQVICDLTDALSNNTTLKVLDLQGTNLDVERLEQLTDALEKYTKLTTLHLGNNQIGIFGAQYVARLLRNKSTIETLYLPSNRIRNEALQYLMNGLEDNRTVTTLDLQSNGIEDSEVQYLAMILSKKLHF
ncbi:hypothetical protein I4U23_016433 [Adineta vaga]|nr:hypothetical protein I4U23_016433 [Adineta vaga]